MGLGISVGVSGGVGLSPAQTETFLPGAATFDGTADYLLRDAAFTGLINSATGIFSGWIKLRGGDAAAMRILRDAAAKVNIARLGTNVIFVGLTGASAENFQIPTSTTYTAADLWLHILASWNTNAASGAKIGHLYINDVNRRGTLVDPNVAFNVDYNQVNWAVGSRVDTTDKFNGDMAELYFAPGQFLDFSVEANRRKFIDVNGLAVDLGDDGTAPTGIAPVLYLSLRSDTVADFAVNRGTGGGMTVNGALSAAEGPNDNPFDPAVLVASATGDDGNSGASVAEALETLGAVDWSDSLKVGLVGAWREHIEQPTTDGLDIRNAGLSGLAEIRGDDVITGWTEHATQANVREKSVDHDGFGTDRFMVFEDEVQLTRVANVATCNSTAGSYVYKKASDGDPATIQIHPSDSGDPNSNGKVYEVTVRASGILIGDDGTVEGIKARRALGAGGCVKGLLNSTFKRVLAVEGTKHNIYIGSGLAEDCIGVRCDAPTTEEPASTYFVAHQDDPTGLSVEFRRCFALADLGGSSRGTSLVQHGTGAVIYSRTALTQVATVQAGAWEASALTVIINGYYADDVSFPFSCYTDDGTFDYLQLNWATAAAARQITTNPGFSSSPVHRYRNFAFYDEGSSDGVFRQKSEFDGGTLELSNGVIYHNGFRPTFQNDDWGAGALKVNRTIIVYANNDSAPIEVPVGVSYEGDNNVFLCDTDSKNNLNLVYHGTTYDTLAAWRSATGQDTNSIALGPSDLAALFSGTVADGDFTLGNTGAGALAAALLAGPQQHWDWNLREAVSGPPTAWPDVPETLAEAETYVEDPEGWDFYP